MIAEQKKRYQVTGTKNGKRTTFPVGAYSHSEAVAAASGKRVVVTSCVLIETPAEQAAARRAAIAAHSAQTAA